MLKMTPQALWDNLQNSAERLQSCRREAREICLMYHNHQWTDQALYDFEEAGLPAETWNIIRMYANMINGYLAQVIDGIKIQASSNPRQEVNAKLMTDVILNILQKNDFETLGDSARLYGMLTGLFVVQVMPVHTGKFDQFKRPINELKLVFVPPHELILDPRAQSDNYSEDARYIHRFKWLSENDIKQVFGQRALDKVIANEDYLDIVDSDEDVLRMRDGSSSYGRFRDVSDEASNKVFLVTQTQMQDEMGQVWDIYWSRGHIIRKNPLNLSYNRFSYVVTRLQRAFVQEYYGLFRDVQELQIAINQKLTRFHRFLIGEQIIITQRALAGSNQQIDDLISQMREPTGIFVTQQKDDIVFRDRKAEAQRLHESVLADVDKAKRILNLNDSFLGQAGNNASGRQVRLQQNSAAVASSELIARTKLFYKILGRTLYNLVKQYYIADTALSVSDDDTSSRFLRLNAPMIQNFQEYQQNKDLVTPQIQMEALYTKQGMHRRDHTGALIYMPIMHPDTVLSELEADIDVRVTPYGDREAQTQMMLEVVLQGKIGDLIEAYDPKEYLEIVRQVLRRFNSKDSMKLNEIFDRLVSRLEQEEQDRSMMQQLARNKYSKTSQSGGGQFKQQPSQYAPQPDGARDHNNAQSR